VQTNLLRTVAAVSIAGLTLTACGGGSGGSPTMTAGQSGVQVEISNTINYGSTGTTTTLDCGDGKSLTIGGSNNTITVKGTCGTVNIGGPDNKVTLDDVTGSITTVGLNNIVVYKNGSPKINDVGTNNSISKG
jgi:hypothetical protein